MMNKYYERLQKKTVYKNHNYGVNSIIDYISAVGCSLIQKRKELSLNQSLLLKGFYDEQEENPCIVTDGSGEMWMYALRRMSYPENAELVSAFHFDGKNWIEIVPVTKTVGQYEAPIAACVINA